MAFDERATGLHSVETVCPCVPTRGTAPTIASHRQLVNLTRREPVRLHGSFSDPQAAHLRVTAGRIYPAPRGFITIELAATALSCPFLSVALNQRG